MKWLFRTFETFYAFVVLAFGIGFCFAPRPMASNRSREQSLDSISTEPLNEWAFYSRSVLIVPYILLLVVGGKLISAVFSIVAYNVGVMCRDVFNLALFVSRLGQRPHTTFDDSVSPPVVVTLGECDTTAKVTDKFPSENRAR